jgi:antitoxin Phd
MLYYAQGAEFMNINIENLVSISEANQNFSRIARLVDEKGTAVILKNNAPRYVLLDYSLLCQNSFADDVDVEAAASRILAKHIKAFEQLAK